MATQAIEKRTKEFMRLLTECYPVTIDNRMPANKGYIMLEEEMLVSKYMKTLVRNIDGMAWILVAIASVVMLVDVFAGMKIIPIRDTEDFAKTIVLIIFTPILSFLLIVVLRQLPLSSLALFEWARAVVCLGTLLILNF